jgi:uncharacterized membrane protein YoaK (UPF0700 family)
VLGTAHQNTGAIARRWGRRYRGQDRVEGMGRCSRRDAKGVADARSRARHTLPAIVGFTVGCSFGALLEALIGPWSLALPIGFALLALALGLSVKERV